jgi:hypothetical protein
MCGWLYFNGIDGVAIKAGWTKRDGDERLREHQRQHLGVKHEIEHLCSLRAVQSDESAIKRVFSHLALPGETELFRPEPEILEYIHWLRDQHYAWTPDSSSEEKHVLQHVGYDEWCPKPERRKPLPREVFSWTTGCMFGLGKREVTGDDYYTNEVIIKAARAVMGYIDLDPASHPVANRTVRAKKFYTISDNGLLHRWYGRMWINPPFSNWGEWAGKLVSELARGEIVEACVLAATRTVTAKYFSPVLESCNALCILRGRIPFSGPKATGSPDDGHMIFYFGNNAARFCEVFSELGNVFSGGGLSGGQNQGCSAGSVAAVTGHDARQQGSNS